MRPAGRRDPPGRHYLSFWGCTRVALAPPSKLGPGDILIACRRRRASCRPAATSAPISTREAHNRQPQLSLKPTLIRCSRFNARECAEYLPSSDEIDVLAGDALRQRLELPAFVEPSMNKTFVLRCRRRTNSSHAQLKELFDVGPRQRTRRAVTTTTGGAVVRRNLHLLGGSDVGYAAESGVRCPVIATCPVHDGAQCRPNRIQRNLIGELVEPFQRSCSDCCAPIMVSLNSGNSTFQSGSRESFRNSSRTVTSAVLAISRVA